MTMMIEGTDIKIEEEIADMVIEDDVDKDDKDDVKDYMIRAFPYFTAWNKIELRTNYTYEALKALNVKTLRTMNEGLNEVIYKVMFKRIVLLF